ERRAYAVTHGSGGFKAFSIAEIYPGVGKVLDGGAGLGVPMISHFKQRGFFAGYITGWAASIERRAILPNGLRNWDLQPGGPPSGWDPLDPVTGAKLTVAYSGCHMILADQWQTYELEINYGQCTSSPDAPYYSHVKLWIADEGKPFDLVIDAD